MVKKFRLWCLWKNNKKSLIIKYSINMNDNIGVGIIVGLAIGSSTYIWNSDCFNKTQKYILLLFILFPPLQWVSAVFLYLYNRQQFKKINYIPYIIIAFLSIIIISSINWSEIISNMDNNESINEQSLDEICLCCCKN
jgi:hypothetical protein